LARSTRIQIVEGNSSARDDRWELCADVPLEFDSPTRRLL